ncbi:hypothetical protein PoB_006367600 [Plakobranchus ocellatus]|uniref:Uncharacterized protein n=1 Tax=Plakobranchus ocellatus TaxID=259542 RepID=A0AAV4CZK0_9GAST|nr:hypothetical protein PoB_006367600 [Plakobranchus ocellatus]
MLCLGDFLSCINIDSPCTLAGSHSESVLGMTAQLKEQLSRQCPGFLILSTLPPVGWTRKLLDLGQKLQVNLGYRRSFTIVGGLDKGLESGNARHLCNVMCQDKGGFVSASEIPKVCMSGGQG